MRHRKARMPLLLLFTCIGPFSLRTPLWCKQVCQGLLAFFVSKLSFLIIKSVLGLDKITLHRRKKQAELLDQFLAEKPIACESASYLWRKTEECTIGNLFLGRAEQEALSRKSWDRGFLSSSSKDIVSSRVKGGRVKGGRRSSLGLVREP